MSATLEVEKFCMYFGTGAVLKVEGRAHPIEIYHTITP
jgi:HrpA-like RNA helicase